MQLILISIFCLFLYTLMIRLSTKEQEDKKLACKMVLQASLVTICILWPVIVVDMFWALFVAVLLLVVATYIGSKKSLFSRFSKNGVFGGIWLTIPLYIHLLPHT